MSQRNGDKARFGRERHRKILRRKRTRELRKVLGLENKTTRITSAESKQRESSSAWSAVELTGSVALTPST